VRGPGGTEVDGGAEEEPAGEKPRLFLCLVIMDSVHGSRFALFLFCFVLKIYPFLRCSTVCINYIYPGVQGRRRAVPDLHGRGGARHRHPGAALRDQHDAAGQERGLHPQGERQ
jgi:hypothetical protein